MATNAKETVAAGGRLRGGRGTIAGGNKVAGFPKEWDKYWPPEFDNIKIKEIDLDELKKRLKDKRKKLLPWEKSSDFD